MSTSVISSPVMSKPVRAIFACTFLAFPTLSCTSRGPDVEMEPSMQAFRLTGESNGTARSPGDDFGIASRAVSHGPVGVPVSVGQNLVDLVIEATSFSKSGKKCKPRPGVGVRRTTAHGRVEVLLCFECDMISRHKDGKFIDSGEFDEIRPQLARAVKVLFPDDEVIQGIAEVRE